MNKHDRKHEKTRHSLQTTKCQSGPEYSTRSPQGVMWTQNANGRRTKRATIYTYVCVYIHVWVTLSSPMLCNTMVNIFTFCLLSDLPLLARWTACPTYPGRRWYCTGGGGYEACITKLVIMLVILFYFNF